MVVAWYLTLPVALQLDMNRVKLSKRLSRYGLTDSDGKTDLYIELQRDYNRAKNKEVTGDRGLAQD